MPKKDYLVVGKILGTRGIRGELKVEYQTDTAEDFLQIKNMFVSSFSEPLEIDSLRLYKSKILMKINSVDSPAQANSFHGKLIYARREDISLDENRYFIEDLKGCKVVKSGCELTVYGILKDVINTGANDIYVVSDKNQKEYLVPITDGTVEYIDLENNIISINPIKGVFDDN